MFVTINQLSVVALLAGIAALSYGQLMNNELVPSTLNFTWPIYRPNHVNLRTCTYAGGHNGM